MPGGARRREMMSMMKRVGPWAAAALFVAFAVSTLSGCSNGGSARRDEFVARADAKRYDLKGKVVRADLTNRKVTLAHDAIPDYMDAMTMEFSVKEQWAIEQMGAGDTVQATLVIDGARSWIESPAITKSVTAANAPRGSWVPADPGTPVPDVPLVDQDNTPFRLARFKGGLLLVTFSFTRCPLPDYCPLMMKHFAALEKETAKDASPSLKQMRLLTVTIDPAYDTPARLREYGAKHATGDGPKNPFSRWTLATGTVGDVKKLAGFFGLDYYDSTDRIIHSLRTAIVDPDGRVVKVFEGNEWTVEDVMRELRAAKPAAAPRASE
jgi:protein SCO1/2